MLNHIKNRREKGMWKKIFATAMAGTLAVSMLAGCGGKESANAGGSNTSAKTVKGLKYNDQDVSKHVDLVFYVIGDVAKDEKKVLDKINDKLNKKINADITVKHMSYSDYAQKYSLVISSGESVDMMYASDWAGYSAEATKGAFAEVTDKVLKDNMPLTKKNQPEESFEQAQVGGKTYFVPNNNSSPSNDAVLIRGDLREKYGIDKIETADDLEKYYEAVAKNEDGIFPYAASQINDEMNVIMLDTPNEFAGCGSDAKMFYYRLNDEITPDNVFWRCGTDEYKANVKKMKEWSDKGFWSKNAITNSTDPKDAFTNGTSASYIVNLGTCGVIASQVEKSHPDWKPEIYDVNADKPKVNGTYTGNGVAVLASSKNQARAFMATDLLKFDPELYDLVRHGIKDVHWVEPKKADDSGSYWMPGDSYDNYPFGTALSWGFTNFDMERNRTDRFPSEKEIGDKWIAGAIDGPLSGFKFDDTKVKNEISNLQNVRTKYAPLLDLGLAGDVDKNLKEFNKQAEAAGLDKVLKEYKAQLKTYIDAHKDMIEKIQKENQAKAAE